MRAGKRPPVLDLELGDLLDTLGRRNDLARRQPGDGAAHGGVVSHRDRPAREDEDDHPQSTEPPLTFRISPVTCRARSEQRNTIGPAMSIAEAIRPIGIVRRIRSFASPPNAGTDMSVSTQPGATELTVMSRGASSIANDFTNEMIAPFDAP